MLGHPNTRVLVSHGGYHSVYEAMFHAVPVVGAPFQFEQVKHRLLPLPSHQDAQGCCYRLLWTCKQLSMLGLCCC